MYAVPGRDTSVRDASSWHPFSPIYPVKQASGSPIPEVPLSLYIRGIGARYKPFPDKPCSDRIDIHICRETGRWRGNLMKHKIKMSGRIFQSSWITYFRIQILCTGLLNWTAFVRKNKPKKPCSRHCNVDKTSLIANMTCKRYEVGKRHWYLSFIGFKGIASRDEYF